MVVILNLFSNVELRIWETYENKKKRNLIAELSMESDPILEQLRFQRRYTYIYRTRYDLERITVWRNKK